MRNIRILGYWALVGLMPLGASAGGPMCSAKNEAAWTGRLTAVNADNHTITAKSFWQTKTFNVGDTCAVSAMDKKTAALSDLRPGEKVKVRYQKTGGVLIARLIALAPLPVALVLVEEPAEGRVGPWRCPAHDLCHVDLHHGRPHLLRHLPQGALHALQRG